MIFPANETSIYGWDLPWQTVSHNQRVAFLNTSCLPASWHPPIPSAPVAPDGLTFAMRSPTSVAFAPKASQELGIGGDTTKE